jgi:hypothetical protein
MYDYAHKKDDQLIEYVQLPHHKAGTEDDKQAAKQWEIDYLAFQDKARNDPDPDSFLQNPNHYSIGITNGGECYSNLIFA